MADPSASLAGKVALVTGGGSGIGRAGALAFGTLGARVMVADLNDEGARETIALIEAAGGAGGAAMVCDVTDEAQVEALIAATAAEFGRLDMAFNNAGLGSGYVPLHETSIERWRQMIDTNLTSTFLCIKHEVRHFLDHGGGAIVNTSSGAARIPAPGNPGYSAAKRGVVALTAHVANDYARASIRANAVLPGLIDTPAVRTNMPPERFEKMHEVLPSGVGMPADIGDVAAWLCTDGARFINGQAIVVDGGGILS